VTPRWTRWPTAWSGWRGRVEPAPCLEVKAVKESGRDRYVSDEEYQAVWAKAHPTLRDAMDLALLTGQRPADVLKIKRADIHDGALWIVQNKTGAKRAIEVVGELAKLIDRINARPRERLGPYLVQDDDGKPLRADGMRSRFTKAREAAGVSFQFRDIRAKAATDAGDLSHSQVLLGHKRREMTEHYVRQRVGVRVRPLR
jgi:integrase